jgi:hypothetical protein
MYTSERRESIHVYMAGRRGKYTYMKEKVWEAREI